jgi:translation initiation factor IF-2
MTEANGQEANEQEQKRPLTLVRCGTRLELRRPVETGQVRQSFSHGRSGGHRRGAQEAHWYRAVRGPGRSEPAAPVRASVVARAQPRARSGPEAGVVR